MRIEEELGKELEAVKVSIVFVILSLVLSGALICGLDDAALMKIVRRPSAVETCN